MIESDLKHDSTHLKLKNALDPRKVGTIFQSPNVFSALKKYKGQFSE